MCLALHIGHLIVLYTLCWVVVYTVLVYLCLEWFVFFLSLLGKLTNVYPSLLRSWITYFVKPYGTALLPSHRLGN